MRRRDDDPAPNASHRPEIDAAMHDRNADRAESLQVARVARKLPQVCHVARWTARLPTLDAVEGSGWTGAPSLRLLGTKELMRVLAPDQCRVLAVNALQPLLQPQPDRMSMGTQDSRQLVYPVEPEALHAPCIESALAHWSGRQPLDQGADILDLPRGRPGAKLDGLGEASGLHAGPPCRPSDWQRSFRR